MSTVKSIYLQHLNGTTPNATMDTNGNFTVGGTVSGASSNMFRNRIINGDMRIDQRNAGAAVSGIYGYGVDRWAGYYLGAGTGRFSAQQSTTAPTGFKNSWLLTVTTADAAPSSGYGYGITHTIEGYNTADFNFGTASALPVTISFWVRSSVTGTFPLSLANGTSYRVYGTTYTINSANTWEYKTVTISGDTSGTWATDNTSGFYLVFGFGGGSTRTFSTGWQSGSGSTPTNVTGCTQLIATNGATFYITGVQLEVGTAATPFEFRSFGTELALCQRYYEKSFPIGTVPADNINTNGLNTTQFLLCSYGGTNAVSQNFNFLVQKRSAPTMTFYNNYAFGTANGTAGQWKSYNGSWQSTSGLVTNQATDRGFITAMTLGSGTTGQSYFSVGEWVAASEL